LRLSSLSCTLTLVSDDKFAELIKRVDESFAKTEEQIDLLSMQIERLNEVIKGKREAAKQWEVARSLLSKRLQGQSESSIDQTEPAQNPPPLPTSIVFSESEEIAYGTKSAAARKILVEADAGITPKELTEKMEQLGHEVSPNFASGTLYRLKAAGEVVETGGRYFWVPKSNVIGGTIRRIE
jgi:hypothetical protein